MTTIRNPHPDAKAGCCDRCDDPVYYRDFLGNAYCDYHLSIEYASEPLL